MRAAWLFVVAACYHGPDASLSCKIACEGGCPSGMACSNGLCASPGDTCAAFAGDGGLDAQASDAASTPCVTSFALGRRHGCALLRDHTVWCSGENDRGQLATGTLDPSGTPVQALDASGPIADATAIDAGAAETCVVRAGGAVWCWGANGYGQVGNDNNLDQLLAVPVVQAGGAPLTGMVDVSVGYRHACARDATGAAWCWGDNTYGQLGDGTIAGRGHAQAVTFNGVPVTGVASFATGQFFNCYVDGSGQGWCFGDNRYGQLGNGSQINATQPTPIGAFAQIAPGGFHACGVHADGTVACWGDGSQGRLGDGTQNAHFTPNPVLVEPNGEQIKGVATVAAGGVSCALTTLQHVLCWGVDRHGQNRTSAFVPSAITTSGGSSLDHATELVAHYAHACVRRGDGSIACWGRDSEGEFGDGSTANHPYPAMIGATCAAP